VGTGPYSSIKYRTDLNGTKGKGSLDSNKRTEQILNFTKIEIKTLTGILTIVVEDITCTG
jgi:hypothetical protein